MSTRMSVVFYQVELSNSEDLWDQVSKINSIIEDDKKRSQGEASKLTISIEDTLYRMMKFSDEKNQLTFDFSQIRMKNIPSKINSETGVEGNLQLTKKEGLGENTLAIYYRATRTLAIQQNRFGVSPTKISQYLSELLNLDAVYLSHIPGELSLNLDEIYTIKNIEFSIAKVNNFSDLAKSRKSLKDTAEIVRLFSGGSISAKISADRNSELNRGQVLGIIKSLISEKFQQECTVRKLKITGARGEGEDFEFIDVLSKRLRFEALTDMSNDDSRRISFSQRKKIVSEGYSTHKDYIESYYRAE